MARYCTCSRSGLGAADSKGIDLPCQCSMPDSTANAHRKCTYQVPACQANYEVAEAEGMTQKTGDSFASVPDIPEVLAA